MTLNTKLKKLKANIKDLGNKIIEKFTPLSIMIPIIGLVCYCVQDFAKDFIFPDSGFYCFSSIYPIRSYNNPFVFNGKKVAIDKYLDDPATLNIIWLLKSDGEKKINFDSELKLHITGGRTNFELQEIKPDTGGFDATIKSDDKRFIIQNGLYREKIKKGHFTDCGVFVMDIEREGNRKIAYSVLEKMWDKNKGVKHNPFSYSNKKNKKLPLLIIDTPYKNSRELGLCLLIGVLIGWFLSRCYSKRQA